MKKKREPIDMVTVVANVPNKDKEEPPVEYGRLMEEVEANLKRMNVLVKGSPEGDVE